MYNPTPTFQGPPNVAFPRDQPAVQSHIPGATCDVVIQPPNKRDHGYSDTDISNAFIAAHLLRALHKFQHTCVERLLTNVSRHFQGVFSLPTKTRSVSSNWTTANLCAN